MNNEGYTVIKNKVIYDHIPGTYYHLLDILNSMFYGNKDTCWPSQKTLAKMLFCSVRTIQRGIKWLKGHGYILVTRRGLGLSNLYTIIHKVKMKAVAKMASTVKKVEDTIKKVKNTYYSNKKKDNFNNFKQRSYNYQNLEDMLLGKKDYDSDKLIE